jgi:hypothetical protein
VTYDEAAASVEAANAAIDVPKARLKVFYAPPASKVETPLMDLSRFESTAKLLIPTELAGRYHVEDARGIRVLDFNFSAEQSMTVTLVGEAPFFLRSETEEANITMGEDPIIASRLTFSDRSASSKGSVERSFRRHLYETPFGRGFLAGARAAMGPRPPLIETPPVADSPSRDRRRAIWGWSSLGVGLAVGAGSGLSYFLARRSYDEYRAAEDEADALSFQDQAERRLLTSRILLGAASALAVTGVTLLILDGVHGTPSNPPPSARAMPTVLATDGGVTVGINGVF